MKNHHFPMYTLPVLQTWKDRRHMLRNFRVGNPQGFILEEAPVHLGILGVFKPLGTDPRPPRWLRLAKLVYNYSNYGLWMFMVGK